ncbi:tetraacyldisaccharide 4'-kinase [Aquincola sp. J276]|nr:tetraacyldisaccharide 4'-kinase [Aquincola sp. J276]MCR5864377.1 tetraacyldisaccharide 4'-kinase [Aquincola sp. J276]
MSLPAHGGALAAWLQRQWWRPRPTLGARLLQPLSWLYRGLAALHRRRSAAPADRGPGEVPVVVVGNLIVGGAGKTPSVIALVRWLRGTGWTPGVISRGYGRGTDAVAQVQPGLGAAHGGDEPLLIQLRTGVPVWVGADRVATLAALRAAHPAVDIVVSDDGLQHHRLRRDVQLVVFDERGAGNGLLLPAGPLREPLPPALPPRTLVLYNAPAASTPLPGFLARRSLAGVMPLADWWAATDGAAQPLQALQGRPLHAAAGIASPERFFGMLEAAGLAIERLPLPDHHDFATLPWPRDTEVVITEKDAVKLRPDRLPPGQRVWVATLDFPLPPGLAAALQPLLPPPPSGCPAPPAP